MTEEPVSSPPSPQRPHLHVSWLHLLRLWRYRVDKICSQTDMNTWFSVAACMNVEYHQAYCLRLAHRCTGVFPLDNMSRLVCHKRLHHHRIGHPGAWSNELSGAFTSYWSEVLQNGNVASDVMFETAGSPFVRRRWVTKERLDCWEKHHWLKHSLCQCVGCVEAH